MQQAAVPLNHEAAEKPSASSYENNEAF